MSSRHVLALTLAAFAACASEDSVDDPRDADFITDGKADGTIAEGSPEALAVLQLANQLDEDDLWQEVGLDYLAAKYIISHRVAPYQTLLELDRVPYVGPIAFSKLLYYAKATGLLPTPVQPNPTVHVPAGPFVYTTKFETIDIGGIPTVVRVPDMTPSVAAFDLDMHEVTNADYRDCIDAGACVESMRTFFYNGFTRIDDYQTKVIWSEYPALWVTRSEAESFCAWRGGRLPTDQEWVKAARGGCEYAAPSTSCGREDVRRFPWAGAENAYDYINPIFAVYRTRSPGRVGSKSPKGDSPYGAQDMVGNAAELVTDPNVSGMVYRGGSMFTDEITTEIDNRDGAPDPTYTHPGIGFRCAY